MRRIPKLENELFYCSRFKGKKVSLAPKSADLAAGEIRPHVLFTCPWLFHLRTAEVSHDDTDHMALSSYLLFCPLQTKIAAPELEEDQEPEGDPFANSNSDFCTVSSKGTVAVSHSAFCLQTRYMRCA